MDVASERTVDYSTAVLEVYSVGSNQRETNVSFRRKRRHIGCGSCLIEWIIPRVGAGLSLWCRFDASAATAFIPGDTDEEVGGAVCKASHGPT